MNIIQEWPPNKELILAAFGAQARAPGVIFCYGNDIYSPTRATLPDWLHAHEAVHARQQAQYPGGPDAWWQRYAVDLAFRFTQELPAHQAEYKSYCQSTRQPHLRSQMLGQMARRLSGPLYGRLISFDGAKLRIKNG